MVTGSATLNGKLHGYVIEDATVGGGPKVWAEAAVAAYQKVRDDSDLPQPYRDLALVRMTAVEFDTLKPQAVIERLKPLAVPGNPWFGSAGEMAAIAYLKLTHPQQAGRLFAELARDKKVPDSIRARADQMAGSLGFEPVQQPGANQEGK